MRKRLFIIPIVVIFIAIIFILESMMSENKIEVNKNNTLPEKYELTEKELLNLNAIKDEIYDLNLFLRDSMSENISDNIMIYDKIDKIGKFNDNLFAQKFIQKYNDSKIDTLLKEGTDLEKMFIYMYSSLRTNHYEGLGDYLALVNKDLKINEVDNFENIQYIYVDGFDKNGMLNNAKKYTSSIANNFKMLICFKNSNNKYKAYVFNGLKSKWDGKNNYDTGLSIEVYEENEYIKLLQNKYNNAAKNFGTLKTEELNDLYNRYKDFLEFYYEYKNEIFYPKWDNIRNEKENINKKIDPFIGMSSDEVLNSTWGEPESKNITKTKYGKKEQWIYGNGKYVYVTNGFVTAIQTTE